MVTSDYTRAVRTMILSQCRASNIYYHTALTYKWKIGLVEYGDGETGRLAKQS